MRIRMLACTSAAAFAIGLTTPASDAAVLANEHFPSGPYTAGSDLAGQNGWSGNNAIEVDAQGLDHPTMLGETGYSVRGLTSFNSNANVSAPTVGNDDRTGPGTLWFAGLVSMNDTTNDHSYLTFQFDQSGAAPFSVGLDDNEFAAGGSTAGFSGTQYTGGTTALIVGRMTVTSTGSAMDETFDFWFNPTNPTSEAALTSSAQGTILNKGIGAIFGDWGSVTIGVNMGGSNTDNRFADEIRVGDDLADLNLIPEPTTMGLLALGGLMLLRRRG